MSKNKLNQIKTLPDIVEKSKNSIRRGPFGSSLKKSFFVESGFKVYQQGNAIRNDFEYGEYFIDEDKYKELNAFKVQPEDIIISCSGTIGKLAIAPKNIKPGIINQALLKITLDRKIISNEYFSYFFKNYVENGQLKTKGAAIKNIVSVKKLKKIPIPVPSLSEQHRIVSKLDALFAEIDASLALIDQNIAQAEALKLSVLDEEFSKLESDDNAKTFQIGDKKYLELIMGQSPLSKYYNKNSDGLPFFQGKKQFGELYPEPDTWCTHPTKIAEKGDILLSIRAPVGPTNLAKEKCCIGRGLAALRPNKSELITKFILYHLKNFELEISSKGQGSTFNSISGRNLKKIKIVFPTKERQLEIVKKLDALFAEIDALVLDYTKKRDNLEALKSSLLDQAFKGEL